MLILYSPSTPVETAGVSMTQCRLWGMGVSSSRGWKYSSELEFHLGQVGRPCMTQTAASNHITALMSADCNMLYSSLGSFSGMAGGMCDWLWCCPELQLHLLLTTFKYSQCCLTFAGKESYIWGLWGRNVWKEVVSRHSHHPNHFK